MAAIDTLVRGAPPTGELTRPRREQHTPRKFMRGDDATRSGPPLLAVPGRRLLVRERGAIWMEGRMLLLDPGQRVGAVVHQGRL